MELQEVRNTILVELSHPVDVVPLVNRMDFAQCTYLLSVLKMEKMRVVNRLFYYYLGDENLQYRSFR